MPEVFSRASTFHLNWIPASAGMTGSDLVSENIGVYFFPLFYLLLVKSNCEFANDIGSSTARSFRRQLSAVESHNGRTAVEASEYSGERHILI